MTKKSKFVVFILSFIPGLSHLYVERKERAVIFFGLFFGVIFGVVGMSAITGTDDLLAILALGLPVIWFAALVDAFSWTNRSGEEKDTWAGEGRNFSNRKLITVALSVVPGAGHMYLGRQKQGVQLMSAFFFTAFLMGWLHMSLLLFVLPVLWFYAIFDAFHQVEKEQGQERESSAAEMGIFDWLGNYPKWVGWGLILLGSFVVFDRIVSPFLSWEIKNYIQTGLVSLVLIFSGIKLLTGSKVPVEEEDGDKCEDGE
ncbi:hypothetical protein [Candidatus Formimonas warabiya]|uniref:TM2 domain-containing protein n=1 Tax=Formimonas warabiya TaxID=1761012 RepID=A0A3G1KVJ1_FORW1|nr:hypothetical protein [Candidatus Formimonas warabiya]ATW26498.1 hypothetical protein DCMF_18630 [Candidatus Formimonas warabiya]